MKSKNQGNDVDATNPIRERLKDRHSVDFSSATRRRLALLYQKRDEWFTIGVLKPKKNKNWTSYRIMSEDSIQN